MGHYMKLTRLAAAGAAIAMIGGSMLFAGTAATADSTNYYQASDFIAEVSPYPTQWFVGDGSATDSLQSVEAGLQMTGKSQILNGSNVGAAKDLTTLIGGANFSVASGAATFQISLFAGPDNTNFTTLRPTATNSLSGDWTLSRSVAGLNAGQSYTLDAINTALNSSEATPTLLAYGAFVNPGSTATIESITWNGSTSVFTAKPDTPTAPVTPAAPATPVKKAASFTG